MQYVPCNSALLAIDLKKTFFAQSLPKSVQIATNLNIVTKWRMLRHVRAQTIHRMPSAQLLPPCVNIQRFPIKTLQYSFGCCLYIIFEVSAFCGRRAKVDFKDWGWGAVKSLDDKGRRIAHKNDNVINEETPMMPPFVGDVT